MNELTRNIGIASGSALLGGVAGYVLGNRTKKRTTKRRRTSRAKVSRKSNRSNKKRRYPQTQRKRKDTSHRRIRYTKNNQPYIILKSGKARFIKKSSVRNSRKRRGGRY
jgi:membrane protein YqaA with SNARE-associated domain